MAFKLKDYGGYGSGTNGTVTDPDGQINSYASVLEFDSSNVKIGTPAVGAYEDFTPGTEIMLHVSATNGTSTATTYLGKYLLTKITEVRDVGGYLVLTVDKDFTAIFPSTALANYQIQAITVAHFGTLTIETANISPIAYSTTNGYGGILAIKCSTAFNMNGGTVLLDGLGIPTTATAYRPVTTQESQGLADTDTYAGWENHITVRNFLLSCGCGAVFIMAKAMNVNSTEGYIGGNGGDSKYMRYVSNSINRKGGASILIAADTVTGFDPKIIDCSYGSGVGLGRCYIASNDVVEGGYEGIFAYDRISNRKRVSESFNVRNYGDGSNGLLENPTVCINNYAHVTGINALGNIISIENATSNNGSPAFEAGTLVMVHVSKPIGDEVDKLGRFKLCKIVGTDMGAVALNTSINDLITMSELTTYDCQLVTVFQATSATISNDYTYAPAWDNSLKRGGIFACACQGVFDITGGKINMEGKGGGKTYSQVAMKLFGNAQNAERLPLGSGHGSVFILANEVIEDANTRIGATYTGNALGGSAGSGSCAAGSGGGAGYGGGGSGGYQIPSNRGYGRSGMFGGVAGFTPNGASDIGGYGVFGGIGGDSTQNVKGGNGIFGGTGGDAGAYASAYGPWGGIGGNGSYGGIGGKGGYGLSGYGDGGKGGNGFLGGKGGNGISGGGDGADANGTGTVTTFPDFMYVHNTLTQSTYLQGAHIMLIADTITTPRLSAISTGGQGGIYSPKTKAGFPGWAFIYVNNVTGEDTSGVVVA